MTCQTHRQVLFDVARGIVPAAEPADVAQAHAAECQACGAWFAEQQRLTLSLRAVAHDTHVPAPRDMERRLDGRDLSLDAPWGQDGTSSHGDHVAWGGTRADDVFRPAAFPGFEFRLAAVDLPADE